NLLSNAFKFTDKGRVDLCVAPASRGWNAENETLNRADRVIAFSVTDSGIGIASDKLKIIFEPFQQADTGTARKYGGTGLGLSISREIAGLLGGELRVESKTGAGSTFTLFVPQTYSQSPLPTPVATPSSTPKPCNSDSALLEVTRSLSTANTQVRATQDVKPAATATGSPASIADDRGSIQPGDRVLLIIEDDQTFAPIMLTMA